jgi:hypothetical protein
MAELLVDFITSLDGYAAAGGWPGWWGLEGPEYLAWLGEQPEADYTVLMGATTYRVMSGFAAEGEPGTDALAGMSKVVFSTTLSEPPAHRAEDARFELARRCHQHAFQVCERVFAEARDRTHRGNLNPAGPPRTVLNGGE